MPKFKTQLGQLIDCPEEEFRDFCKDKDLGYLSSFHNLMVQTFNEVQELKDDLVKNLAKKTGDNTPQEQSVLEGMYSKLMRIEQRVFILRELIKMRQIEPTGMPS